MNIMANKEGYPDNWDEIRREVYKRDNNTCQYCSATDVKLVAHHVIPKSKGGTHNLYNLVAICGDCHENVPNKAHEQLRKRKKKRLEDRCA